MDRKDFLTAVGITTSSFILINCIGCSKGSSGSPASTVVAPTGVNFTLDLTSSANAVLLNNGGFLVTNGVIVAKTTAGAYIAVQQSCTHENYTLVYQGANQRFYCNNHGSTFTEKGVVTLGPASMSLTAYNTSLIGTSLRVYS